MVFNKINKIFLLFIFQCFGWQSLQGAAIDDFVVVIDAGHGGKDAGAHGPYGNEKDVTLNIALNLGQNLKQIAGVKVIYTRSTDVFIPLATRAQIANDAKADLFISIHCNANNRSAPYGTETWVLGSELNRESDNLSVVKRENSVIFLEDDYEKTYDGFNPNSPEDVIGMTLLQDVHYESSIHLAHLVEKSFSSDQRLSRGVKQSGFAVLWRTAMPSVLIETGFISNPTEGKFLCSSQGQWKIANSITRAFKEYKALWDKKNYTPVVKKEEPKEKPLENGFYKIQFLASKQLYPSNAPQMRGLNEVFILKENGLYKYFHGETNLNSQKDNLVKELDKLGFKKPQAKLFTDSDTFSIELFDSNKKYHPEHSIFSNLPTVERIKNRQKPKFTYQITKPMKYADALKTLKKAKDSGFDKAVLVKISK